MTTLLEKALAAGGKRKSIVPLSDEQVELVVAWAEDKITTTQICKVMEIPLKSRGSIYNFLAQALREAVRRGVLGRGQ